MRYVIMAGGPARRWKNYMNIPKHLAIVSTESLLERIVRQLKDNHVENVSITSNNPLYEFEDVERNELIYDCKVYNMFYYKYLDDEVMFLYGDTYYTDEVMKQMLETKTDDILFFGTKDSVIGIKVNNYKKFKKYVEEMKEYKAGQVGWAMYRKINNLHTKDFVMCDNFVLVDDYIVNVNTPDDYEELIDNI